MVTRDKTEMKKKLCLSLSQRTTFSQKDKQVGGK